MSTPAYKINLSDQLPQYNSTLDDSTKEEVLSGNWFRRTSNEYELVRGDFVGQLRESLKANAFLPPRTSYSLSNNKITQHTYNYTGWDTTDETVDDGAAFPVGPLSIDVAQIEYFEDLIEELGWVVRRSEDQLTVSLSTAAGDVQVSAQHIDKQWIKFGVSLKSFLLSVADKPLSVIQETALYYFLLSLPVHLTRPVLVDGDDYVFSVSCRNHEDEIQLSLSELFGVVQNYFPLIQIMLCDTEFAERYIRVISGVPE